MGKRARFHGRRAGHILAWAAIASLVFQLVAIPPRPAAADQLAFFQVIRGVQLAQAGFGGMRGSGAGTIAISGVTGGVTAAYLYWHGPTRSTDASVNAAVTFSGTTVIGQNIGFSNDNCWLFANSQAYRADVTGVVKAATFTNGSATFALAAFRKTTTSGTTTTVNADVNGVSLLVFYTDPAKAAHDYLVWNGNDSNVSSSYDAAGWDMTFSGISFTGGSANLTLHVGDGQTFTDHSVLLNGNQLLAAGPNFQGDSTPMANNGPANNGSLWDIHTYDVARFIAGTSSLRLTTGITGTDAGSDCISLVAAVLELPAGATAPDGKITLTPASVTGPQGSALSFTATPVDGSSAAKAVTFAVSGANTVAATAVQTDMTGHATFTYTPANAGTDTVTASFVDAYGLTRSATATANIGPTAVSGVAQCLRQTGETTTSVILNVAALGLVEVLSGTAVVTSQSVTTADGSYSITGLAPNTTFTVRYSGTVNGVRWLCSVPITTNGFGGGFVPAPTPIVDRGNHRFKTAYTMAAGGEMLVDFAYLPHQSNYYRVQVHAGQAISVHLLGLTRNLEVVVYKDPFKILAGMGTATLEQVRSSAMGAAPDEYGIGAPDEYGIGAPDEYGIGAPDEFGLGAPDELGLGAPDELGLGAPDELGLGAPDEFGLGAPDEFGLGAPDATEYTTAVRRALIALSRNTGTSDESLTKQTWNDDEFYYVRVVGATGNDYDSANPYALSVSVDDSACAATTPNPLKPYQPGAILQSAAPTTSLVLTNTARLLHANGGALSQTEVANLKARLGQIGTVVDVADDVDVTPVGATVGTGIMGAFAQWDANKTCYLAANIVTDAIHSVVNAYRGAGFQFLTIAAPDGGVPFRRYPDRSPVAPEDHYRPPVRDASASNASLRSRQVLTDDFYGALNPAATNIDIDVVLPDAGIGIGRVVESYEDVIALLDSYALKPTIKPTSALVTAYDFLADLGVAERDDLLLAKLTVDAKIEAEGLGALDPTAWSTDDLRALLPTHHDLLALNAHFSAAALRAANGTHLTATELGQIADLRGVLMISNGCHAAFNTIDADAVGGADISSDFASTLNGHGGYLVAGTGYQYGGVKTTNYDEIIQRDLVHSFRLGTGAVSVGKALTQVKRNYRDSFTNLNVMDYKALNETVLYGFPQLGVDIQQNRIPNPSATPFTTTSLSGGLSYRDFTPSYTLHRNDVTDVTAGETRTFFDISGDTQEVAGFPIEPRFVQPVVATDAGAPTLSRGAVLFSATYTDVAPYIALAEIPATEAKNKFPPFISRGVYPTLPFRLNSGENVVFTPAQFVPTSATDRVGTGRKLTSVTARVFYFSGTGDSALAAPPSVYDVVVTKSGTKAHVTFKASAAFTPGIADAFVTFTATTGSLHAGWASTELKTPTTSTTFSDPATHAPVAVLNTYAADIETLGTSAAPEDVRVLVQAVGGNGTVGVAANRSTYFRIPPPETATATAPKQPTDLALTPPSAITYGGTASVTATLTAGGQPLAGKSVRFTIGARRASAVTGLDGTATANLVIDTVGTVDVIAAFAEDLAYTGSSDSTTLTVGRATPALVPLASTGQYSDPILLAKLTEHGAPIASEAVRIAIAGNSASRVLPTDPWGQVTLDTLDFGGLGPGHYDVTLTFPVLDPAAEDDRYVTISSALGVDIGAESATILISSPGPQPAGPVTLSATVVQDGPPADRSLGDLRTANVTFVFHLEDGSTIQAIAPVAADGSVSLTTTLPAGVYAVTATVGGNFVSAPASVFVPVFDATTFVTGGGWILTTATTIPAGGVPLPAGKKGNFAFNVKYQAGTPIPTGSVLFKLNEASINLKSTGLDWLVIATGHAESQGTATINGSGAFKFRVIAIDGTPDRFEIRIWDPATGGSFDLPLYIASNALGSGNIVIH